MDRGRAASVFHADHSLLQARLAHLHTHAATHTSQKASRLTLALKSLFPKSPA